MRNAYVQKVCRNTHTYLYPPGNRSNDLPVRIFMSMKSDSLKNNALEVNEKCIYTQINILIWLLNKYNKNQSCASGMISRYRGSWNNERISVY